MKTYLWILASIALMITCGHAMTTERWTGEDLTTPATSTTTEKKDVTTTEEVSKKVSRRKHSRLNAENWMRAMKETIRSELEGYEQSRQKCLDKGAEFYYDLPAQSCHPCEKCWNTQFTGSCTMQCRLFFKAQILQEELTWLRWANFGSFILAVISVVGCSALFFGFIMLHRRSNEISPRIDTIEKTIKNLSPTGDKNEEAPDESRLTLLSTSTQESGQD